jgi:flavin reductase (DIM6/NTAB) family NADH-FMN oxidoreductase RutF
VLLTTADKGSANAMTMSWHTMVDFEPPLIACIVSPADYSYAALRKTGECVIAVPAVELADKVVRVGNTSGRDMDKFAVCRLREHMKMAQVKIQASEASFTFDGDSTISTSRIDTKTEVTVKTRRSRPRGT